MLSPLNRKNVCKTEGGTAERVLLEHSRLAFFDPRKLFNADGLPKAIDKLNDNTAAAIASLEVASKVDGAAQFGYRFVDNSKSIDALAKYLGLYGKDNAQKSDRLAVAIKSLHENNKVGMPAKDTL
jgi:phage terminase small subunit